MTTTELCEALGTNHEALQNTLDVLVKHRDVRDELYARINRQIATGRRCAEDGMPIDPALDHHGRRDATNRLGAIAKRRAELEALDESQTVDERADLDREESRLKAALARK